MSLPESTLLRAADLIRQADGLLITAGAGMGVDSGLPDFRGDQGLWQHYPALGERRMGFAEIASPHTFHHNPALAWGFYGHRLQLYRHTAPHAGFALLQRWASRLPHGAFVYTSNVDGQFQKAGFPDNGIVECHGSIHHLQCMDGCSERIWRADDVWLDIDEAQCLAQAPLPHCPGCGGLARPNILMFDDWGWVSTRTRQQRHRFDFWRADVETLVVIELGAGTAIPSVRHFGERQHAPLIRINPRESRTRSPANVSLPMGALEALRAMDALLGGEQA